MMSKNVSLNSRRLLNLQGTYLEMTKTKGAYRAVDEYTERTVGVSFQCPACKKVTKAGAPVHGVVMFFIGVDPKLKPAGRWEPAVKYVSLDGLTLLGEATLNLECGLKMGSVHGGSVWWA